MALLDPHHRSDSANDGPHPALFLAGGFGVIVLAAFVVHLAFNLI